MDQVAEVQETVGQMKETVKETVHQGLDEWTKTIASTLKDKVKEAANKMVGLDKLDKLFEGLGFSF
jgi:uncharacterized protein YjbJ (UPF0337 family)